MKNHSPSPHKRRAAFTLIEMIGVMAIMAILAAAIAPNVLRTIERAAVKAETETLHTLGEQAKLYLRENNTEPTAANWNTVLANASYVAFSPTGLLFNSRQPSTGPIVRMYVQDPIATNQRAMLLSSMKSGVALPASGTLAANFSTIWNTPSGSVPAAPGWGAWNASNVEYLVIERINFKPVYLVDLQDLPVILTTTAGAPSYRLVRADGTILRQRAIFPDSFNAHPNQKLELYRNSNYTNLDSTYVFTSRGAQYNFNVNWAPSGP